MANEFSTGKSIFILAIVAGCFAVLWPNIFYPMLIGSYSNKNTLSTAEGCCDVIFDSDVNAIKIMIQLCEKILKSQDDFEKKFFPSFNQGKLTKDIVDTCHDAVLSKCSIDITEFLREKVRLGKTYKQILDGIRSLNSSLCLKENFGVSMGQIGLPRAMRVWGVNVSKHMRQERPPHLRPELMHPALREKGRAIPQSQSLPQPSAPQQPRPGPVPGLRPPMGGAGHVVPPPKGSGTMGIVMPMYTVGIVVFFLYTMMKLMFKKSDSSSYDGFTSDQEFQRVVFENSSHTYANNKDLSEDVTKLVVSAISGLVQEVNRQIRQDQAQPLTQEKAIETEVSSLETNHLKEVTEDIKMEEGNHDEESKISHKSEIKSGGDCTMDDVEDVEGKGVVKVLGMEMTESCEGGAKWSRPPTPLSRPSTPQNIYLPGSLPSQSQLLVSDSHTETLSAQDNAVVLTGKVTLSLIGLIESESKGEGNDEKQVDRQALETTISEGESQFISDRNNRKELREFEEEKDGINSHKCTENPIKNNEGETTRSLLDEEK